MMRVLFRRGGGQCLRRVLPMVVMLRDGGRSDAEHGGEDRGEAERDGGEGVHASILTSRIIPASMWYSRWQWKAQRPSASARTR